MSNRSCHLPVPVTYNLFPLSQSPNVESAIHVEDLAR